jgi:MoaA/NifB/PqqE/SkfB family radical SAM enzyme
MKNKSIIVEQITESQKIEDIIAPTYKKMKHKLTVTLGDIDQEMVKILPHGKAESYLQYRDEFNRASNFTERFNFPVHVDIELSNLCNYSCAFCVQGMTPKPEFYKKKKTLHKEKVLNILDQCSEIGVKSVQFNGQDEPTLYPHLIEIIQHASHKGFDDIYFNTNGSKLTPDMSQSLVDAGLTKIQISIDAFSQKTYSQVRKKETYEKVVSNILDLVNIRDNSVSNLPLIRVSFVINELNKHEAEDFKKFWLDNVDFVAMQNLIDIHNETAPLIESAETVRCNMPYFRVMIKADGGVKPCCTSYGDQLVEFGNMHDEELKTIWNSDQFRAFQELHKEYRWQENDVCRKCINSAVFYE